MTPAHIFIGTYNVSGQQPRSSPLETWLGRGHSSYDILVVSLQEVDEAGQWEHEIKSYYRKEEYCMVTSSFYMGLIVLVFVHVNALKHVQELDRDHTNMKSGKGVVIATKFKFGNESLCFVACHLPLKDVKPSTPNADFQYIQAQIQFKRHKPFQITDHSHVFWFGSFSYGINLATEEIRRRIHDGLLEELWQHDQVWFYIQIKRQYS